jgi:Co/Zn/Cd efflux system component
MVLREVGLHLPAVMVSLEGDQLQLAAMVLLEEDLVLRDHLELNQDLRVQLDQVEPIQDLHLGHQDRQQHLADLHLEVALFLDHHHQEVVVDHLQDLLVEAEDVEDN